MIADAAVWRSGDLEAIAAYVRRRSDPAAQPDALFDQAWYLATYPDAAATGVAPLVHYLLWGAAAGTTRTPWRTATSITARTPRRWPRRACRRLSTSCGRARRWAAIPIRCSISATMSPRGRTWPQERTRSPTTSAKAGGDGLTPHPLFDVQWYRRQLPAEAAETPPLVHYLTRGWREGLTPHPLVDPAWYLERYPEVAEAGAEPLTHYLTGGAAEGRNPSPWFDTAYYLAERGEALGPDANPLADYVLGGAWSVAAARPGFATLAYIAAAPEMVAEGLTPLEHWARKARSDRKAQSDRKAKTPKA